MFHRTYFLYYQSTMTLIIIITACTMFNMYNCLPVHDCYTICDTRDNLHSIAIEVTSVTTALYIKCCKEIRHINQGQARNFIWGI